MNNASRKRLAEAQTKLSDLLSLLDATKADVRQMAEDEQEKFDNLPEGLQQGERGQSIEEAAQALGEMADRLDEAHEAVEEFTTRDIP